MKITYIGIFILQYEQYIAHIALALNISLYVYLYKDLITALNMVNVS